MELTKTFPPEAIAMAYRHRAVGYLAAAQQVRHEHDVAYSNIVLEPKYFLLCHSIELTLKSFLLVRGFLERQCQDLSHDLEKALACAVERGLYVSEQDSDAVVSLSREHKRPFTFRYFKGGAWSAPMPERVVEVCETLLRQVQPLVFAANNVTFLADNEALQC